MLENGGDADLFLEHMEELKQHESRFYYNYMNMKHQDGTLFYRTTYYLIFVMTCFLYFLGLPSSFCNIFWYDSIAHDDYAVYGGSITFDTTYKTNKYNLVLGLFYGINNQKGTIIFITGFLFKVDVDSFVWLFTQFLRCMGKPSKTIITDQDPA